MATCIPFQTQLSSIMEVMVKTAVAEISKLVDDKCAYLHLEISRKHLEISRKQTENDMLRKKLLMMQKVNNTQMHRGLEDYIERDADVGTSCPEPAGDLKLSEIEDPTAQFTIKEESPDERLIWTSSPVEPVGNSVQYNSTSTERHCLEKDRHLSHMEVSNRTTPNKFHDSHSSALHRDRPTSALQFTVKTEKQEEDPLGFNQNRCQQSAGKQNQLPAVFAVEERDNQLWSSIIEGNDIDAGFPDFSSIVEEYSKGFSDHSYTQNVGATNKSNGGPQASAETACNGSYNAEYDKDNPQPQPSSFLPRPQATYSEQDSQSEQLFSQRNINSEQPSENSERDYTAITDRPLDSQPHSTFRSGNLHLPHRMSSGPSRGYMCTHCGKAFNRLHHLKLHQQSHKRKRAFVCTICGKSFQCSSHLRIHYRTHTGEKPYCCGQCGKRFSQQSSLGVHLRTHSGERPYSCGQCGKSFILLHHLKRHRVIHTYS